jgi:quinol monooxygenase YgiN
MTSQIVIAMYRPHEGKDAQLRELIAKHIPALRKLELITDRPALLMRSANGTYLEIFEWRRADSAGQAHQHPAIAEIWEAMGAIADLPALSSLEEAEKPFPHFEPVTL